MPKFAHVSDLHIGAFRLPLLQSLVLEAFNKAMDICIDREVDFVVVSGDLFDSNIPDMGLVNAAVRKMSEVREKGIRLYVIYGSHDFSPTQTSIVDILESAGLFTKVTKSKMDGGRLKLEFTVDQRSKAKLCGISGRRLGIEKEYYDILDRQSLEEEPGFKIFVLHGALTEFRPKRLAQMESLPLSLLPRGFAYYAGGHVHERIEGIEQGYTVAYPGPLFGADYSDLESSAMGLERGFFIVDFSDKVEDIEFVPVKVCEYEMKEYDAEGRNSVKAQSDLQEIVNNSTARGKLFLLKVAGEMSGGKTSDIDFQRLKNTLKDRGALEVFINHTKLASKDYTAVRVAGGDVHDIEEALFREKLGTINVLNPRLKGEAGVRLSKDTLKVWTQPRLENEEKGTYDRRIAEETLETLRLEEAFS